VGHRRENLVVAGDVERGLTRALGSPAVRFEGLGSLSHRLAASP
jgi:hypothetical protein